MSTTKLPLTLNFDESLPAYGWVELSEMITKIPNMEEYFIAPVARWFKEDKEWEIVGYSLVHISQVPSQLQLLGKFYQITGDVKYKERIDDEQGQTAPRDQET